MLSLLLLSLLLWRNQTFAFPNREIGNENVRTPLNSNNDALVGDVEKAGSTNWFQILGARSWSTAG